MILFRWASAGSDFSFSVLSNLICSALTFSISARISSAFSSISFRSFPHLGRKSRHVLSSWDKIFSEGSSIILRNRPRSTYPSDLFSSRIKTRRADQFNLELLLLESNIRNLIRVAVVFQFEMPVSPLILRPHNTFTILIQPTTNCSCFIADHSTQSPVIDGDLFHQYLIPCAQGFLDPSSSRKAVLVFLQIFTAISGVDHQILGKNPVLDCISETICFPSSDSGPVDNCAFWLLAFICSSEVISFPFVSLGIFPFRQNNRITPKTLRRYSVLFVSDIERISFQIFLFIQQ